MKVRELVRLLRENGWVHVGTTGSHHHYKHPSKPGKLTVPGNANRELRQGTLQAILKQAGLR